jgi:tetratricopeptide (TPR) repeat protein
VVLCGGFSRRLIFVFGLLVGSVLFAQQGRTPMLVEATQAYQQGKTAEAEQILTTILKKQPDEPEALLLMGMVLDAEQRYPDAESYYRRVLRIATASAQLFNNVGNHYLASGDRKRARDMYLKAIAADTHHVNANLQLAQMSVEDRQGQQALTYLSHVNGNATSEPGVLLLRARALAMCGRCAEANEILKNVGASNSAAFQFSAGMALAECKSYTAAEESFSLALEADPQNFEVLYNLGLAALRAGHAERAESVLQTALGIRPNDPDLLYALAQATLKRERPVQAVALLAKAQKGAADRADTVLLLAQVLAQLEFYEDSADAYSRYLRLRPDDDAARRERGFDFARAHELQRALPDLQWYVARHPQDAVGYFELAMAEVFQNRAKAHDLLNRAIGLDPKLRSARYFRAVLNIEDGNAAQAISDLQFFLEAEPENFHALAHLGQAYLAIGRANEAVGVLERARNIAPDSPLVLVQYQHALEMLGRKQEAAAVLTHLEQCGKQGEDPTTRTGLMNYLNLSPADQQARYLATLRENNAADPGNMRVKISLARTLFSEGKQKEGLEIIDHLKPTDLDAALKAECGRILLDYQLFGEARNYLKAAMADTSALSATRLDLAIAIFHLDGPVAALQELDKTPAGDRNGDYYLERAQILDAQGKVPEAAAALNQGMRAAPTRADLYYQAASFLLKHKLYKEAESLLEQASRVQPDNRELLLAHAVTLNLLRRNSDSDKLLDRIQARWPEWNRVYLLKGILLEIALKSAEARQTLETAIALGANTPEAYYYQALAIMHSNPPDLIAAQNAIEHAIALTSRDPYIYLQAGKISLARKEYPAAVANLLEATRLEPTLIPAHYGLRHAYSALGDEQKSLAEMETIKRIANETGGFDEESRFAAEDFLFTVRPPR